MHNHYPGCGADTTPLQNMNPMKALIVSLQCLPQPWAGLGTRIAGALHKLLKTPAPTPRTLCFMQNSQERKGHKLFEVRGSGARQSSQNVSAACPTLCEDKPTSSPPARLSPGQQAESSRLPLTRPGQDETGQISRHTPAPVEQQTEPSSLAPAITLGHVRWPACVLRGVLPLLAVASARPEPQNPPPPPQLRQAVQGTLRQAHGSREQLPRLLGLLRLLGGGPRLGVRLGPTSGLHGRIVAGSQVHSSQLQLQAATWQGAGAGRVLVGCRLQHVVHLGHSGALLGVLPGAGLHQVCHSLGAVLRHPAYSHKIHHLFHLCCQFPKDGDLKESGRLVIMGRSLGFSRVQACHSLGAVLGYPTCTHHIDRVFRHLRVQSLEICSLMRIKDHLLVLGRSLGVSRVKASTRSATAWGQCWGTLHAHTTFIEWSAIFGFSPWKTAV